VLPVSFSKNLQTAHCLKSIKPNRNNQRDTKGTTDFTSKRFSKDPPSNP